MHRQVQMRDLGEPCPPAMYLGNKTPQTAERTHISAKVPSAAPGSNGTTVPILQMGTVSSRRRVSGAGLEGNNGLVDPWMWTSSAAGLVLGSSGHWDTG